jgi:hypothetical protein
MPFSRRLASAALALVASLALAAHDGHALLATDPRDLLASCGGACADARVVELDLGTIVLAPHEISPGVTVFEASFDFSQVSDSIRAVGLGFDLAYAPDTIWAGVFDPHQNGVIFAGIADTRTPGFTGWLDPELKFSTLVLSSQRRGGLMSLHLTLVERPALVPEPGAALVFAGALALLTRDARRRSAR